MEDTCVDEDTGTTAGKSYCLKYEVETTKYNCLTCNSTKSRKVKMGKYTAGTNSAAGKFEYEYMIAECVAKDTSTAKIKYCAEY